MENNYSYTLFETRFGWMSITWCDLGVSRVRLPMSSKKKALEEVLDGCFDVTESKPPKWIFEVIRKIGLHFEGSIQDFQDVPLCIEGGSELRKKIYHYVGSLSSGSVDTYGGIASRVGAHGAARAVGSAMSQNQLPLLIPCHRVIGASGNLGGFSAEDGVNLKRRLLEIEGVVL